MINRLQEDEDLRPYFIDYLTRNMAFSLTDTYVVKQADRIKFQMEFYESLFRLSEKVAEIIEDRDVNHAIYEAASYYMQKVGKVTFEPYPSTES